MARLNTSNPTVVYGRQSPSTATKTRPYSFQRTTISSPLRPNPKRKQEAKTKSGFTDFKIFEDGDDDVKAERSADEATLPEPSRTTEKRPLKLTHTNSITSGLSKRASQESSVSLSSHSRSGSDLDEEESSDKENIFLDDEAEEASAESEEDEGEVGQAPPRDLVDLDGGSNLVGESEAETQTPQLLRYRESRLKEDSDDSPSEYSSDSDSDNSLKDFIVSDDEDLSYYESETGLDEEDEEEEELKPPTPRPTRRRLIRGRKPRDSNIIAQTKELSISAGDYSPDSPHLAEPGTPHKTSTRKPFPSLTSSFTHLSPNKKHNEETEVSKNNKAKRSPLRESINSASSTPETRRKQEKNMQTPPSSPSKIVLPSPSKTSCRIPPSPHRQSSDAFWSQEVTNEWNDQWSPPKQKTKSRALERLLAALGEETVEVDVNETKIDADRKSSATPTKDTTISSPTKSPSKTALKRAETAQKKEAIARKRAFDDKKTVLAQDFLTALDEATSGGQVAQLSKNTGGIKIVWSKTLRSTAGRAKWRQEKIKQPGAAADVKYLHHASIELAEHVIDDENRLLNTLAHEYCHLANYMVSGVRNQPHGASFKQWGRKCVDAIRSHPEYKEYPIEVTTKHSYQIDYKYLWMCIDCGHKYGRHSKSIDPDKARCSLCKGGLQQVKPKPRKPAASVSPQKKKNFFSSSNSGKVLSEVSLDNMVESLGNANLDR